ncbi:hypothetical protein C2S51_000319 [Perilla frutescens var. frutescens]|nr:hypothetical protein C2S51_000319 [Perilla frutescens var. frutescens]
MRKFMIVSGSPQIQKHRTGSRLSSDSYSSINGSIRDDVQPVEIGQNSFGRVTARPVDKLLAERVLKETEPPKRRSLSAIARLLRREGLPSLWNAHKQKKGLLDNCQQKNTSISIEANRQLYDDQSNRRSSKKQQEFKDSYPDLEASSFVSGRYSSRWSASSMLTKSEMALIKQNLEAKRLTYDETSNEKLHHSEDLDDTLEMLDSRLKLMQFGRKQNSCTNLVHDQRGTSSSSLGSRTTLLNLPSSAKYGNLKSRRPDRDTTGKCNFTYHPDRDDGLLLDPHYRPRAHIAHNMSDIQLEEKNRKNILPTQIVVLSPNLGDRQNDHGSSPYHSQGYVPNSGKMKEYPSVGSVKELSWRKTKSYYDAEFMKPVSVDARKLANKVTRRLRDACEESEDAMYSGLRGYLEDESLYDAQESDIDSELEMFKRSSRSSVADDNKWGRHPSSRSVHEEAKKRLAERWKITQRYRDLEIVGKGSTLGEILSTPDGETMSKKTTNELIERSSTQVGIDSGSSVQHDLLGTISRGDLKNKTEGTSRSRSVPPIGGRINGKGTCHDMLATERHMQSEPTSHGTSKVTRQCPSHKDHFSSQGSKFRGKKPLPCPPIYIEEMDSSSEARFEIEMEATVKDLPYQRLMFQMAEEDDHSGSDVSEIVTVEHGITTLFSRTPLLHPKHSSVDDESSSSTAHDRKDFCHQGASEGADPSLEYFGAEPVSSESSKDADDASPVSVLVVPSIEDASSSSESVERVSVELNELRMQLQLLKMESDAYHPVDKDTMHSSLRAEGWEASYTLDVLIHAGLQDFGFDLFRIMWHNPDCPLDSRLFDNLEEKYCDEITCSRPERKLLFDRINSALSVIFLKHVDVRPWVMPKLAGSLNVTWQKERARDTVEKLIDQESANELQVRERMLDRDMQWTDSTDEIAVTGNQIEELLIDDMIDEFLLDLCW